MGDAIGLLKKTQGDFVSSASLGVGEPIVYTHANGTEEGLSAFIGSSTSNKKDKQTRENIKTFSNVFLQNKPQADDIITYDNVEYLVLDWDVYNNMYIIRTENNKRHNGRRRRY